MSLPNIAFSLHTNKTSLSQPRQYLVTSSNQHYIYLLKTPAFCNGPEPSGSASRTQNYTCLHKPSACFRNEAMKSQPGTYTDKEKPLCWHMYTADLVHNVHCRSNFHCSQFYQSSGLELPCVRLQQVTTITNLAITFKQIRKRVNWHLKMKMVRLESGRESDTTLYHTET